MSWILTIVSIVALVVLHELGHFAVAKATGMRVERFSLFFPPRLFGVRRGETEYTIGAIPAGGYVKITGMTPQEVEQLEAGVGSASVLSPGSVEAGGGDPRGAGVNILIAFVLFWVVLMAGNRDGAIALSNLDGSVRTVAATTEISHVNPSKPATDVLRTGDRIVGVDHRRMRAISEVQKAISGDRCPGTPVNGCTARRPVLLMVHRAGRDLQLAITPRYSSQTGRMLIGVEFEVGASNLGPLAAAGAAGSAMWLITHETLSGFVRALTSSKVRHETSSIVGITQDTHASINAGAGFALVFIGFVSLVLAVINLFPFLPLDGGHVLWAVAEKVTRRRVSLSTMMRFSSVGLILLAFLVISGVSNDIHRLAG